ncbi:MULTISPECIES: hypothetical protein [unclassified Rhizobacter]|uniref:hypothetical protein n=1 Tax=unclassified Rhizobacter TaxID=2640088 RepID=UPI000ABF9576|nr:MULTISPECIES: hypothetical protein [unclassified Rhizobacter]
MNNQNRTAFQWKSPARQRAIFAERRRCSMLRIEDARLQAAGFGTIAPGAQDLCV